MTIHVEHGANLMNALLDNGLPVASSCHGDGICSMCRVQLEGETSAPPAYESEALKRNKCAPDERLSCQISVTADLTVRTKYW